MTYQGSLKTKISCAKFGVTHTTREKLLQDLSEAGYDSEKLDSMKAVIDAQDSDVYDVLTYVAYAAEAKTRTATERNKPNLKSTLRLPIINSKNLSTFIIVNTLKTA